MPPTATSPLVMAGSVRALCQGPCSDPNDASDTCAQGAFVASVYRGRGGGLEDPVSRMLELSALTFRAALGFSTCNLCEYEASASSLVKGRQKCLPLRTALVKNLRNHEQYPLVQDRSLQCVPKMAGSLPLRSVSLELLPRGSA